MGPDLAVAVAGIGGLLAYFGLERARVASNRRAVPLRICVTGTRGKSSVVRLIAAGLSAGGTRTLAKTTGSRACVILPSGEERPLVRRGTPSILEQRAVLRMARREEARALVVEVMSIRPENYAVELGRIVLPHVLALTNVRPDHTADLGESSEDAARAFAAGVPARCRLVLPQGALPQSLVQGLERRGVHVRVVGTDAYRGEVERLTVAYAEWADNVRLALAVCAAAGVSPDVAAVGMQEARADFGALRAWRLTDGGSAWIAVNAFAANDPVSTMSAYRRVVEADACRGLPLVGVFNVRSDRGDRTAQWCRVLASGTGPELERLLVVGDRPGLVARRVRLRYGDRVQTLPERVPEAVTREVQRVAPSGGVLFGFGNIGGLGAALVEHWEEVGEPVCLSSSLS